MALAAVLDFPRHRVATGRVERREQWHAGEQHADRTRRAAWRVGKLRLGRQLETHGLLLNAIGIAVVLERRLLRPDREIAGAVVGIAVRGEHALVALARDR